MPRRIGLELATHVQGDTTTLAQCWRIARQDGVILRFTDHDRDVVFLGETYLAAPGFTASDAETTASLAASNRQLVGLLDAAALDEDDLLAGKYDGARIEMWLLNWTAPEQGGLQLPTAFVGGLTLRENLIEVELRGVADRFRQQIGEVFSPECRYDLGDSRCTVNLDQAQFRLPAVVTAVASQRACTLNLLGFGDRWADHGRVRWTSGDNAGTFQEIRQQIGTEISLIVQTPFPIQIGDEVEVTAGCDRQHATCRDKFNNVINFGGFPHIPGALRLFHIARRGQVNP